jgi:hypothetical protein
MTRGGCRVLDESGYRTAAIAWPVEGVPATKVIRLPSSPTRLPAASLRLPRTYSRPGCAIKGT